MTSRSLLLTSALLLAGCAYQAQPTAPSLLPPPLVETAPTVLPSQPAQPLYVIFSIGPSAPLEGESAAFTATVNGQPMEFAWLFGDGGTDTTVGNTTQHTYRRAGSYTSTVTVTNDDGQTISADRFIHVRERERDDPPPPDCPTITLAPGTLPNGTVGTNYSRTITASGGTAPYGFAGVEGTTFPNGLLLDGAGVLSGTPTTAGTFTFLILAIDENSCRGVRSYTVTIANQPPTPGVMTASMSCTGHSTLSSASCNITGTYNGAPVPSARVSNVDWDWGDGSVSSSTSPAQTHLYTQPGTYTVIGVMTATTTDGPKTATASRSVTVPAPPTSF